MGWRQHFAGLVHCICVHIQRHDAGIALLGNHQGDESAAGAHIQHPPRRILSGHATQQYAIGTYLHAAAGIRQGKLLEMKKS
jgi:hypothetical protein